MCVAGGGGGGGQVRRQNLKSLIVVLFEAVSFLRSFECTGGLNVTDDRRERIPLLWSTVGEPRCPKALF